MQQKTLNFISGLFIVVLTLKNGFIDLSGRLSI